MPGEESTGVNNGGYPLKKEGTYVPMSQLHWYFFCSAVCSSMDKPSDAGSFPGRPSASLITSVHKGIQPSGIHQSCNISRGIVNKIGGDFDLVSPLFSPYTMVEKQNNSRKIIDQSSARFIK
jgi:hypothetical protein